MHCLITKQSTSDIRGRCFYNRAMHFRYRKDSAILKGKFSTRAFLWILRIFSENLFFTKPRRPAASEMYVITFCTSLRLLCCYPQILLCLLPIQSFSKPWVLEKILGCCENSLRNLLFKSQFKQTYLEKKNKLSFQLMFANELFTVCTAKQYKKNFKLSNKFSYMHY